MEFKARFLECHATKESVARLNPSAAPSAPDLLPKGSTNKRLLAALKSRAT